jgi:hypothetical protein
MLFSAITTIQEPTASVLCLVERLNEVQGILLVAGDSKGPPSFEGPKGVPWPVEFLSLEAQVTSGFRVADGLPTKHYARKNIAYLQAIRAGAECIYETDDDNAPNATWRVRNEFIDGCRVVPCAESRWVNVYGYFSAETIWPRGLPLNEIRQELPSVVTGQQARRAPIQQGLVDGSPDVDAIWRLVMDREFAFDPNPTVYLEPGNWCPFNTQSTWWWPVAYPLLYIPSYCSFRMCDIWKSFVAQRCLWAMGMGVAFHASEVVQKRNPHDLTRDFSDEIPGYQGNRRIAELLDALELDSATTAVSSNLLFCYEAMVEAGFLPSQELDLVRAWLDDVGRLQRA